MKFVTFLHAGDTKVGALCGPDDSLVLDLEAAARRAGSEGPTVFDSMLVLLRSGDAGLDLSRKLLAQYAAEDCVELKAVRLLAPVPVPEQIRDFANYEGHVRQAIASAVHLRSQAQSDPKAAYEALRASGALDIPPVWYERPLYFKGNRFTAIGHDAEVVRPSFSSRMDYELELAVVIGKQVKNLPPEQAMDAIFGYTIFNDFSARDMQSKETSFRLGPAKGKDFDTGNAFGPCIVTKDEIPDPYRLRMRAWVNGELRSDANSGGMQHDIARTISYLSQSETLYPGEILGLGTVTNGCGYESLTFLNDGDEVELEVEGIGRLRNRLVAAPGT